MQKQLQTACIGEQKEELDFRTSQANSHRNSPIHVLDVSDLNANDAFEPDISGRRLKKLSYQLNIAQELASNIGTFRNAAGIHYRSDMEIGIDLGEQVAIAFLREEVQRYPHAKYIIQKRNGQTITIP